MAGFMSGFAGAIVENIKENRQRKRELEDDVFKMSYKSYLDNKDKYNEYKERDRTAAEQAKVLAASTENPEESYKAIYGALKNGVDFKYLSETLQENKIKLLPTLEAPKAEGVKTTDEQMAEMTAQQIQQKPGMLQEMFGAPEQNMSRYRTDAVNRIAQATGEDPIAIAKMVDGRYEDQNSMVNFVFEKKTSTAEKLGKLEEELYKYDIAKKSGDEAKAEFYRNRVSILKTAANIEAQARSRENPDDLSMFVTTDENGVYNGTALVRKSEMGEGQAPTVDHLGNPIKGRIHSLASKDFQSDYLEMAKQFEKQSEEYNSKSLLFLESASISNKMIKIAREDPAVLNYGGALSSSANTLLANTRGVIDFVKNEFNSAENADKETFSGITETAKQKLDEQEQYLSSVISDKNQDLGTRAAAYKSLLDVLAFKFAAMEKQEGRDVTEKDFERFRGIAGQGTNPDTVESKLNQFLVEKMSTLEGMTVQLKGNKNLQAFENAYGVKTGFEPVSLDDLIARSSGRQDAQERYQILKGVAQQSGADVGIKPQNLNATPPSVMEKARQAIASGKDPEAVRQRLIENGFDPGDL